jgi:sugar phosphate isomerase/epimerase
MDYSRRDFTKIALAGLPSAYAFLHGGIASAATQARPNSKWAGVQVGMNVPYNFSTGNYTAGDVILKRCVDLGVSGVELRAQPVELFMGSPAAVAAAATAGAPRGGGGARGAAADPAAQKAAADETRKWRMGASLDRVKAFRKTWDDAGVLIEIVKWDGIFDFSDEELDYAFEVSRALGARALSSEISIGKTKRLGQFADKHKMQVGYHGHTAVTPAIWEATFAEAKYNAANLDIGHFVAGNNTSPVPFLKQYPDRITHIHVKDRRLHEGPNVEFGTGDTPIKEVLRLMRDNKWNIQATIEFEIPAPPAADGSRGSWTQEQRTEQIAKCIAYCKECLLT